MVDAVVSVFLDNLLKALSEESRILVEFRDQFEKLQSELLLMQGFLKDADRLKRKEQALHTIMVNLRELIFAAEDILADCQLQSRDNDPFSAGWYMCIYPKKLPFQYQTGKRLKEINKKILEIKKDIRPYFGVSILNQPVQNDLFPRWSSPVYDHTQVVGLEGKRYLIVMDDVWGEDVAWWQRILEGLPKGNGSTVIITSRNEKVVRKMGVKEDKIHWPKCLSRSDSWLLFRKIAFAASGGECTIPELENIGKEIVVKCKGLPLAIKVVDKTYNGTIYNCTIHDMVRDLVLKVAEDDAFYNEKGSSCRHLGIQNDLGPKHLIANQKLRALLSTNKTAEVNKISSSMAKKVHESRYLRVLDVSRSIFEASLSGLGRLSNLEVLLGFRPARSSQLEGCRIGELRNLTKLRTLGLQITRADEIGDNEVNALINLQELQYLSMSCFDSHGSDLITKVDKLFPPQQLHELCLKFYPGKMSPMWLNPISLPFLKFLSISSGDIAEMNERFWGDVNTVWKIEALMLESLSNLGVEWLMVQQVMPSLRVVNVSWCPELGSFPVDDFGFRGGVWKKEEHRS
ncbi:disease resistance rpp13-like protein 4 [Quercus suber]|uniref:Disease resistance rpp13-like protein 4 n=1 Tax=Quercus suber TaxID=58331 RepID=A0AAW0LPA2_QUESU